MFLHSDLSHLLIVSTCYSCGFSSIWLWKSHQGSEDVLFFRNHLLTIHSTREDDSASILSEKKRIQIFSPVRISRNILEVFLRKKDCWEYKCWDLRLDRRWCARRRYPGKGKEMLSSLNRESTLEVIFPVQRIRPDLGYMGDLISTVWPFIAHTNHLLNGIAIWLFNGCSIPFDPSFVHA